MLVRANRTREGEDDLDLFHALSRCLKRIHGQSVYEREQARELDICAART